MFTFLLANFASGLVIYWAWNNLLSLTQQYVIMKRNGAEIHLWKNLGVEKAAARLRPGGGDQGGQGGPSGGNDLLGRTGAAVRGGVARLAQQMDGLRRSVALKLQPAEGASRPASASTSSAVQASGDGSANAVKTQMTREEALEALGLEPGATAAQIDAAYRTRARQNGSLNGSEKLSRARDVLRGGGS
jgi:hypothetical protein